MKKILRYICVFLILGFFIAIPVGRSLIRHIDYNQFISNVLYFANPIQEEYKAYPETKEMFIDDEVNGIEDLINKSEYVLKIKVNKEPEFYGTGIINNVKILEVYKGKEDKNIEIGKNLEIYDLVSYWQGNYINYYGGMTPLNSESEYIVFLKKATKANKKGTYIFSSIKYGHFNISTTDSNVLTGYIQGSLTFKDIMNYDYVEIDCETSGYDICEKYAEDYSKMKKQVLDYIENK